uniref:Uncharacterized protein n=1 Tax=Caenorhabditis japonica TaxID=281687 RepID=A0A8R1I8P7_CAEJA
MGTYEEDSSVSILLRYSSDNDTPDMVFTNLSSQKQSTASSPASLTSSKNKAQEIQKIFDFEKEEDQVEPAPIRKKVLAVPLGATLDDTVRHVTVGKTTTYFLNTTTCKLHKVKMSKIPNKSCSEELSCGCFCWFPKCVKLLEGTCKWGTFARLRPHFKA